MHLSQEGKSPVFLSYVLINSCHGYSREYYFILGDVSILFNINVSDINMLFLCVLATH